jgi:hypothetical protein
MHVVSSTAVALAAPETFTLDAVEKLNEHLSSALAGLSGVDVELLQDIVNTLAEWIEMLQGVKQRAVEGSAIKSATTAEVQKLLSYMGAADREEQEQKAKAADEVINRMLTEQAEAAKKEKAQEKEEKAMIAKADEMRKKAEAAMEMKIKQQQTDDEARLKTEEHSAAPTYAPTESPTKQPEPEPELEQPIASTVSALSTKIKLLGYNISSLADFYIVEELVRDSIAVQLSLPVTHVVFRDVSRQGRTVTLLMVLMGSAWQAGTQLEVEQVRSTLQSAALVAEISEMANEQGVGWFPQDASAIKVDKIKALQTHTILKTGAYSKKPRTKDTVAEETGLEPVQTWCTGHHGKPFPCTKMRRTDHLTFAQKEYLKRGDKPGVAPKIVSPHNRWNHADPQGLVDVKSWCTQPDGSSAPC